MFENVTEVRNLTPHTITIWLGGGMLRVIPPTGNVARIRIQSKEVGKVSGIPVVHSTDKQVLGLPTPKKGVVFLVSSVVAKSVRRPDVLSPDTTDDGVIRDGATGEITAVKRLQVFCDDVEIIQ
jgi:hypothetical protein